MQLLVPACQKQVPPYGNAPIPSHQACVYQTVSIQILCREVASHVLLSFASNSISSFCSFAIKNWTTVTQWYAIRCMCLLHSIYFLSMTALTAFDWEAADVFCSLMSKLGTCRTGLFCRFDLHYNGHLQVCLSWGISGPLYISFRQISTFSVANSLANHPQRNGRSWVVTFQICQYSKAEWAELLHLELAPVHTAACLVRLAKALEMKRLGLGRIRKDSDFSKLKQLTQLIRPGAVKDHDVINHRMKDKGNRGYKSIVIFIHFPIAVYNSRSTICQRLESCLMVGLLEKILGNSLKMSSLRAISINGVPALEAQESAQCPLFTRVGDWLIWKGCVQEMHIIAHQPNARHLFCTFLCCADACFTSYMSWGSRSRGLRKVSAITPISSFPLLITACHCSHLNSTPFRCGMTCFGC